MLSVRENVTPSQCSTRLWVYARASESYCANFMAIVIKDVIPRNPNYQFFFSHFGPLFWFFTIGSIFQFHYNLSTSYGECISFISGQEAMKGLFWVQKIVYFARPVRALTCKIGGT